MTSLFLLNKTWDASATLVRTLKERAAAGEATILALDFWAARKLREASIAHTRPLDFLDVSRCRDLDATAARLARTWYGRLGERATHHGTPLAEMMEYDFTFLFIDALRSVEIALRIFQERDPDEVFLSMSGSSGRPNAICHEALPGVAEFLARRAHIPVQRLGPRLTERGPGIGKDVFDPRGMLARVRDLLLRGYAQSKGFLASLAPLGRETVLSIYVSSYPRIAAALAREGLRVLSLPYTRVGWLKAKIRNHAIRTLWEELRADPAFREDLTYREVPLSEILDVRFRQFFRHQASEVIEYIEGAKWLVRRFKPRVLVVPEDLTSVSRATCRVFRSHGLPILVVLQGAVSVDMGGFHVMPLEAQRIAVWGDLIRDWHVRREKPVNSQVVTGNPGFDAIAGGYDTADHDVRRRHHLSADRGVILLATEWFTGTSSAATVEGEERFIRQTLRALVQFPSYQVVVKLHPGYQTEYENLIRTIAEEEGLEVAIAKEHLWDLLAVSDLAIVSNSTVGIEAMILGKPVVMVSAYEGVEEVPYVEAGAALGASQSEEIAAAIAAVLHQERVGEELAEGRRTFVPRYAHIQDGRASERVAQAIETMMRGGADAVNQ